MFTGRSRCWIVWILFSATHPQYWGLVKVSCQLCLSTLWCLSQTVSCGMFLFPQRSVPFLLRSMWLSTQWTSTMFCVGIRGLAPPMEHSTVSSQGNFPVNHPDCHFIVWNIMVEKGSGLTITWTNNTSNNITELNAPCEEITVRPISPSFTMWITSLRCFCPLHYRAVCEIHYLLYPLFLPIS